MMYFKTIRGPKPRDTFDHYVRNKASRSKVIRSDNDWHIEVFYIGSKIEGRISRCQFYTDYELRSDEPDSGQW